MDYATIFSNEDLGMSAPPAAAATAPPKTPLEKAQDVLTNKEARLAAAEAKVESMAQAQDETPEAYEKRLATALAAVAKAEADVAKAKYEVARAKLDALIEKEAAGEVVTELALSLAQRDLDTYAGAWTAALTRLQTLTASAAAAGLVRAYPAGPPSSYPARPRLR